MGRVTQSSTSNAQQGPRRPHQGEARDARESAPAPKATPSQGPKRARTERPEQASSSSSSRSPDQPQPEDEPTATCIETPIPEGALEYTFITKESSAWCQTSILETTRQPDEYPQSNGETLGSASPLNAS